MTKGYSVAYVSGKLLGRENVDDNSHKAEEFFPVEKKKLDQYG